MLISSQQKIRAILLLSVFLPVVCKAEGNGAPAKFYDGLQVEAQKISKYYTVKQNESLSAIAARYGYSYIKLAQWNDITAPYNVVAGQRLKLFNDNKNNDSHTTADNFDNVNSAELEAADDSALAESYIVEKKQSLSAIAQRFRVTPEQLAAWNSLTSPDQVYAGQKLKIFKNKQKHSNLKSSKNQSKLSKIVRDTPQKTSIISINNKSMLKFYRHLPTEGKIIKNFSQTGGRGIEIRGKAGQAIKAVAAGKVVAVSRGIYGHGGFIVIQHNGQYLSSYANNRRSLVKNGQQVRQGQVIAEMGQVGRKPPSLEFEMRKNGKLVNPMLFLPKKI